jgi:hypothetical protein
MNFDRCVRVYDLNYRIIQYNRMGGGFASIYIPGQEKSTPE